MLKTVRKNIKVTKEDLVIHYESLIALYFKMSGDLYKNGIQNKKVYAKVVDNIRKASNLLFTDVIHKKETKIQNKDRYYKLFEDID